MVANSSKKRSRKNLTPSVKVIVGLKRPDSKLQPTHSRDIMPLKSTIVFLVFAAAMLGLNISLAWAQTADQHNAPGGPRDKVENFVNRQGLTLPPPPPTPPSAPVSTTSVRSPPAAPPKK
jgi:hypothetical protein